MSLDQTTGNPAPSAGTPRSNGGRNRHPARPRRRRIRRRQALAGAGVLAGLVTAVVIARDGGGGGGGGAAATTTAPVEVRDLVLTDEYDGELGYGEAEAVTAGRSGVVTGAAAVATIVGQGDVLFDLDLQPTVLLHGEVPAFRDLGVDADPGADITQLEQALVDLGFGEGVTVDEEFTQATAGAVEAWEEALGRSDPDGVVSLGDVVFAPTDLRVAEVTADRGTQVQSGAEVVQVTATTKLVTLGLTVDEVANVEPGTPVTVTLPDGTEATGKISDVSSEPSSSGDDGGAGGADGGAGGGGDEETYPVTVVLDDPAAAGAFESGSVDASVERSRTEDATAVPVIALLALREGGYAVQVVDDTQPGGYVLVPVEVGTIADEWAQVSGDGIEAGVEVAVPE
ncbi:MAG TPA: HlyD family efflux transporter periplasmic adaptor subunit [Acidimicrobiales bacterium]|nr:HlyD family efflux transporter periplasmic adaptor subunit [Acidimicrobiales bacterium]